MKRKLLNWPGYTGAINYGRVAECTVAAELLQYIFKTLTQTDGSTSIKQELFN